jgi:hypothetical protein
MTELDQLWSQMLADAAAKAADTGRQEIAEYLRLKAANDAIRAEGVKWLFETMSEIVNTAASATRDLITEQVHPHNFQRGNSNMVGSMIRVRRGVRCLTLEAGWTRTPTDGIMRGGALAAARLRHFGMRKADADLSLAYAGPLPLWHFEDEDGKRSPFRVSDLYRHFQVFMGE